MKFQKYDPVCGKKMTAENTYVNIEKEINGEIVNFRLCCPECHSKFEEYEEKYIRQSTNLEKNGRNIQDDLQLSRRTRHRI